MNYYFSALENRILPGTPTDPSDIPISPVSPRNLLRPLKFAVGTALLKARNKRIRYSASAKPKRATKTPKTPKTSKVAQRIKDLDPQILALVAKIVQETPQETPQ